VVDREGGYPRQVQGYHPRQGRDITPDSQEVLPPTIITENTSENTQRLQPPIPPIPETANQENIFPPGLKPDTWEDFIKHRIEIKKPMTSRAEYMALKKLRKFADQGQDANQIVENSIIGGWQGLFPLTSQKSKIKPKGFDVQDTIEKGNSWLELRERKRHAELEMA
jgi:hypothetical protein